MRCSCCSGGSSSRKYDDGGSSAVASAVASAAAEVDGLGGDAVGETDGLEAKDDDNDAILERRRSVQLKQSAFSCALSCLPLLFY